MKKTLAFLVLGMTLLFAASSFIIKSGTGMSGHTGSPGEPTCAHCHGGGTSSAKSVSITSSPTFSAGEYLPDSIYTVSLTINATGFSKFGFGCEILNASNASIGVMQTPGAGVQIVGPASKKNAIHNTPKSGTGSATFTFKWKAPSEGEGDATFFVCGNAVDGNGNTANDLPIPSSLTIAEGTVASVPQQTFVTISENLVNAMSQVVVYPNPSSGLTNISYFLKTSKTVTIELIDISGKLIKQLLNETEHGGNHSHILNLNTVPSGVYFVKTSIDGITVSQKLITVN